MRPSPRTSTGPRSELPAFLAAYLLHDAARWIFASRLPVARENAHQIISLEHSLDAAATAVQAPWAKAPVLLWAPLVTVSVIATGNHYLLDVAAGLLATAVGYSASRAIGRPSERHGGMRPLPVLLPAPPGADLPCPPPHAPRPGRWREPR